MSATIGNINTLLMSGNVVLKGALSGTKTTANQTYALVSDIDYDYSLPEERVDYGHKREYYYAQPNIELSFSVRGSSDIATQITGQGTIGNSTSRLDTYTYIFEVTDTSSTPKKVTVTVTGYLMGHSIRRPSTRQNDPLIIRCRVRVLTTAVASTT